MNVDEGFARLMVLLAEGYPSVKLREGTVRLYAQALADLSLAEVEAAMARAVRENRFFPSAAELRSYVRPTTDDAALLAWTAFVQAAAKVGAYASLDVEDSVAADALATTFGGWPAFCECDGAALGARKAEFMAAYRDGLRRQRATRPVRLLGICDSTRQHDHHHQVWVGRIATTGAVTTMRDDKALPSHEGLFITGAVDD